MRIFIVLVMAGFLAGCGGRSIKVQEDRIIPCPLKPPEQTCDVKRAPGTVGEFELFLKQCRSEITYWRKARKGCEK